MSWTIFLSSEFCPYITTGGMDDAVASATQYTACSIMKGLDKRCNAITCPKRLT